MDELLVTWIAPVVDGQTQLAWLSELGRIQKIVNVRVLTLTGNKVYLDDVATILRSPADVVVWSGHGAPGGLLLSDNSLVRTKWLATQVSRNGRVKVMVMAACGSQVRDKNLRSLTEAICRAGVNVIGFPTQAEDSAAGTFTVEYIRALSVNTSVAQAFDVALEAIADAPTASGVFLTPGILDIPFSLENRLSNIDETLKGIERMLSVRSDRSDVSSTGSSDLTDNPSKEEYSDVGGIQPLTRSHIHSLGKKT